MREPVKLCRHRAFPLFVPDSEGIYRNSRGKVDILLAVFVCNERALPFCKRYGKAVICIGYILTVGTLYVLILSRLVDTFSSRILYPMLLLSGNHSIAVV